MKTTIDSHSLPLRSFVACAVLLATTALVPADTILKGSIGPRVIKDDVIIARGTTCVLNGTTIKGNVRVRSGAKLYANGAWVDGSVYAYHAMLVDLRNSTRVTWNVRGNGTRSLLLWSDTQIGGHVRLWEGSAPEGVDALLVNNSTITGDIKAGRTSGRLRVQSNTIEGKMSLVENSAGPFVIRNNEVFHNLAFVSNNGQGSIIGNTVGSDLIIRGNTPNAVIRRNIVRGDKFIE